MILPESQQIQRSGQLLSFIADKDLIQATDKLVNAIMSAKGRIDGMGLNETNWRRAACNAPMWDVIEWTNEWRKNLVCGSVKNRTHEMSFSGERGF